MSIPRCSVLVMISCMAAASLAAQTAAAEDSVLETDGPF